MQISTRSAFIAAFLVFGALADTDALAQMGGGMRRGGGDRGERSGRAAESASAQPPAPPLAQRLDQVAAQLLLTREQGRAWERFREAFLAYRRGGGGPVSLSDSLDASRAMQQKLSQAQDQFTLVESLSDALKTLDQQLDAGQREAENRLLPALFAEYVRVGGAREGGSQEPR